MTEPLLISGLPRALAQDAWWLDAASPVFPEPPQPAQSAWDRLPYRAGVVALVALADLLFWHQSLGLSLAIFAVAIFAVAALHVRPGPGLWRPMLLLAFAVAPVVAHLQALSVAFLAAGLAGSLIWLRRPTATLAEIATLAPALLRRLPGRWFEVLPLRRAAVARIATALPTSTGARRMLRDWGFPLVGGLVLAALLMQANPVLAQILSIDLDLWALLSRGLFWAAAALFIASLLAPDLPDPIRWPVVAGRPGWRPSWRIGLNAGSVLRGLGLFNLLIAVQSATDLTILAFGAALPRGMNPAEYAHRGAYPLLATALLAGAFALAARPFLGEHRAIRPLLLVWLVQNMVLCGAAMMRLDHYMDTFGLTYLRVDALIWMALVAAGLGLVAVQVLLGRTNRWLIARCTALGLGTLYIAAFCNFAQIIAARNLNQTNPDFAYICALGPMAHGALRDADIARLAPQSYGPGGCAILAPPRIAGWRDWGFRSWRVARYSEAMAEAKGKLRWTGDNENPDRR